MAWFSEKKNTRILLKALNSSDPKKRNRAAREFLKLGEEGAESLVSALGSQDANLREITARIFIRLNKQALPALNAALQNAPFAVQKEAAAILGQIKSPDSLEILFEILKEKDYKRQVLAAKTLGEIGDATAIPRLLVALSDSDPDVRIAVVTALGKFHAPQTYINIADLLDDPEINVRQAAAKTLGETADPSVVPYLVEALRDPFWWYGREQSNAALLEAIAKFGKDALEPLSEVMTDKEPTARRYAISLLGPLKDPRILEPLRMALYDTHYDVARMAVEALAGYGRHAISIFVEALSSPNDWLREQAVFGLGKIGSEDVVETIMEMLNDHIPEVRKQAIQSLADLKDPRALPTLSQVAADRSDREMSRLARQAIAAIQAP